MKVKSNVSGFQKQICLNSLRRAKVLTFPFPFFGCRTSDGGKVVGTIEVSVVKMGEIKDGEASHIMTDVPEQKVGSQPVHHTNQIINNQFCQMSESPSPLGGMKSHYSKAKGEISFGIEVPSKWASFSEPEGLFSSTVQKPCAIQKQLPLHCWLLC